MTGSDGRLRPPCAPSTAATPERRIAVRGEDSLHISTPRNGEDELGPGLRSGLFLVRLDRRSPQAFCSCPCCSACRGTCGAGGVAQLATSRRGTAGGS
jgi:hypothetical protein